MKHYTVYLPDGMEALRTDFLALAREVSSVCLGYVFDNVAHHRI